MLKVRTSFTIFNLGLIFFFCSCDIWNNYEDFPLYLVVDDSEYPYLGIPRYVIETKDFAEVRDTETNRPAKFQIYGKTGPISDVYDIWIRGRGNTSFRCMPKFSLKVEFPQKISLMGLPENKDWALISNYADRTFLRNYMTYRLGEWLGMDFSPKCEFVEVFLNRQYLGLYMLTENIKVSKNRVNIPKDGSAYLLEVDHNKVMDHVVFYTNSNLPVRVHYPKEVSTESVDRVRNHLIEWEEYLKKGEFSDIEEWIDLNDYLAYYWIQELSRNVDGDFKSSIFFTWSYDNPIKMGPLWDFDLSYGVHTLYDADNPKGWYIRKSRWNVPLFANEHFRKKAKEFWIRHHEVIESLQDSILSKSKYLEPYTKNDFKRWPILGNTESWTFREPYDNYAEAVDSLVSWLKQRMDWIDDNL